MDKLCGKGCPLWIPITLILTKAPVLPCVLLRQASPKLFRFINFCFAQGCLWSVCHLRLQTAVKKGVPCGTRYSLRVKVDSNVTAGYTCGKADQPVGNLTSAVAAGVQYPAVPGHKDWAGEKPSPKRSNFCPFPSNTAVPPLCQRQMKNSDRRKAVGRKFYFKS